MNARVRLIVLLAIMAGIVIVVETVATLILYRTAMHEARSRLEQTAKSQARLIEAVGHFNRTQNSDYPDGPEAATLSQIREAHRRYRGFGKTGEFTLSRKEGDQIVFLLSHRHYDLDEPRPVAWGSKLAEPMRRALSGKSGTVIGPDYRGATVLAAHEPVADMGLGIVAKVDLSEIRAPFVRAALISGAIALLVILIGALSFIRITNPILQKLQRTVTGLEKALAEVHTLRGIIPICSFCKKILNDEGSWDMVEVYVREHTDAEFSHGICPECAREHYPDLMGDPDPPGGSARLDNGNKDNTTDTNRDAIGRGRSDA